MATLAVGMNESSRQPPLKVIAGAPGRPLVVGDIKIQCYVLEDEQRVLTQRGFGGALVDNSDAGDEMTRLVGREWLKPFLSSDLMPVLKIPVAFANPQGGGLAYGYPASLLVDICNAIIQAADEGSTTSRQEPLLKNAKKLISGFAKIGIIALVDEATGYQEIRAKRDLAAILERFLSEELRPWSRTFPSEFYEHIFRLKNWPVNPASNRPSVIGHYTNDIVYARLAPGVLDELKRRNPVVPSTGRRSHKHHQWFTVDIGHPKLREHLVAVTALMRSASSWDDFKTRLQMAFPAYETDMLLPFRDAEH